MNPLPISLPHEEATSRYGEGLSGVEAFLGAERLATHAEEIAGILDHGEIEICWSEDDLPEIDAWLDETSPEEEEEIQRIAWDVGILIGEIIIRELGGRWVLRKDEVHNSIYFPPIDTEFFPIHALVERLMSGQSNGMEEFYNSVIRALLD